MTTESARTIKQGRALVLCFDGTTNEYDSDNTNVVKFFSMLKKNDFTQQLCYYQTGVGTTTSPGIWTPIMSRVAKLADSAIAWYLDSHVMDGYRFLMQNHREGDKISLFGFSRGAYIARALAGMLHKVGLLAKDNTEQVPFAYKMYKKTGDANDALCAGFKQTYCQTVEIDFVGVWDTVASVGTILGRSLPFASSNASVKTFRHALSLDENRSAFRPNVYHRPAPHKEGANRDPSHGSEPLNHASHSSSSSGASSPSSVGKVGGVNHVGANIPDVLEVWFAGGHCDVGGGIVPDKHKLSAANIPLRWMVRQVMGSDCGIIFDQKALARYHVDLDTPKVGRESKSRMHMDEVEAAEPIHNDLWLFSPWWALEFIPTVYCWQDAKGVWHREFNMHMGRGRKIQEKSPHFHVSVKQRMKSKVKKYEPKADWTGTERYVE